jgi:pimeloyl-ACP methyl ester carboxylesterase
MSVNSRRAGGPVAYLHYLTVPGARIGYRRVGEGPPLLLLHATLSNAGQLRRLSERLREAFTVIAIDRRGSGMTGLEPGVAAGPIDVAVHIADIGAVLAAEGFGPALVVGHSYGGCLALELAARRPELVAAAWAFEPPYAPVGRPAIRAALVALERATAEAGRLGGPGAAAEAFLAGAAGPEALARLAPASLDRLREAGTGALADVGLVGLDLGGLARIDLPVELALGGASDPLYAELAAALVARISGAAVVILPGARHDAPIVDPAPVAAAIRRFADRCSALPPRRPTR